MKRLVLTFSFLLLSSSFVFAQWSPAGDKIKTKWASEVSPSNVLPEYPRPLIERSQWSNLNGLWKYAIRPIGEAEPKSFDGDILVPFCVESSLSGVQKEVGPDKELWYKRTFTVPSKWKGKNIVLNFGAVDWKCEVIVNGITIGTHQGGYTPFSFDITPYLSSDTEQSLSLRVYDPTDRGYCPRGKQVIKPNGIWYTSVTGIWQTVWIEPVNPDYVVSFRAVPNLDAKSISFTAETSCFKFGDIITVELIQDGKTISSGKGTPGNRICLAVDEPKLWSPDSPYLYDVKVTLQNGNTVLDQFKSYTAMRKISKIKSGSYNRIALNNKVLFNYGPLDQGWWPDGLYTAPTDEALAFDIQKTKDLGFNMIRKHVKVEPARWYYHCDRLGILVWQDMPSGGGFGKWVQDSFKGGQDTPRNTQSKDNYYNEWTAIMNLCYSNPSVVVWVPFNESWGQFDTEKVVEYTQNYDPSRLVNPASGGNFYECGDILDVHTYPAPFKRLFDIRIINVVGEYGGIGFPVQGHLWMDNKNWGYVQFKSNDDVTNEYVKYAEIMKQLATEGISGAVYTQTTDVESEVNGLMTYDRSVVKINEEKVKKANQAVIDICK